jgi:cell division protein FtsQ
VLEAPEEIYASESVKPRRVLASPKGKMRRDLSEDFADDLHEDDDVPAGRRRTAGVRVRFRGLPATKWGRIFAGCGLLVCLGVGAAVFLMARSYLLHDERFVIPSSSSIEFEGNGHVTRAQLLGIFGGDVERNIFSISLEQRRAELERLPWVSHATVMRLLPNRMRVLIEERKPVAFVRQGNHIGLVDANGVLLDMPVNAKTTEHYSFPVVTGISAGEPLSTRGARMKIFGRFTSELDGSGEKISQELSEVDLSDPEDVKALIPDHSSEILVHFGDEDFLNRYKKFKEHLAEWRTVYPKLSSVDMRYERQVVLEMPPGSAAAGNAAPTGSTDSHTADKTATVPTAHADAKPVAAPKDSVAVKTLPKAPVVAVKHPVTKPAAKTPEHVVAKSEQAFNVPAKKSTPKVKKPVTPVKRSSTAVKASTSRTTVSGIATSSAQPHTTQAVHP